MEALFNFKKRKGLKVKTDAEKIRFVLLKAKEKRNEKSRKCFFREGFFRFLKDREPLQSENHRLPLTHKHEKDKISSQKGQHVI